MLSSAVGGGSSLRRVSASRPAQAAGFGGWSSGPSRRRFFWLIEFLAEVLKHVRSALKRIVRWRRFRATIEFWRAYWIQYKRQLAGELRHLRRDDYRQWRK